MKLYPVRVADVPLEQRMSAARRACRAETDAYVRLRIKMLAQKPGRLIAWRVP